MLIIQWVKKEPKMLWDLRQCFWWNNLKREITEHVEVLDLSRDQD